MQAKLYGPHKRLVFKKMFVEKEIKKSRVKTKEIQKKKEYLNREKRFMSNLPNLEQFFFKKKIVFTVHKCFYFLIVNFNFFFLQKYCTRFICLKFTYIFKKMVI